DVSTDLDGLLLVVLVTNGVHNSLAIVETLATEVNLVAERLVLLEQRSLSLRDVLRGFLVLAVNCVGRFLAQLIELVSDLRVSVERDHFGGIRNPRKHIRNIKGLRVRCLGHNSPPFT